MTGRFPTGGPFRASVVAFDGAAGIGTVRLDDGRELCFHATQLADGSRHATIGDRVTVTVAPGHRGCLEAIAVRAA